MTDYTHDDAMRDLELCRSEILLFPARQAYDRLAAYIERLTTEVERLNGDRGRLNLQLMADSETVNQENHRLTAERDAAESERIEAVQRYERAEERCLELTAERDELRDMVAGHKERIQHEVDLKKKARAERDEWEAIARVLVGGDEKAIAWAREVISNDKA